MRFAVQTGGTYEWQNDIIGSEGICRCEIYYREMYLLDEPQYYEDGEVYY